MEGAVPFPLLLDPGRNLRTALGLRRQSLAGYLLNIRAWLRWLRAFGRHRRQYKITGHYSDVPAIAVVTPKGDVTYLHRGRAIGDYPPLALPLSALREAAEK